MHKKALALVLCVLMMVALVAGCQKNTQSEWIVDQETGLTELRIGGIGPLTGDYANYGLSVKQGAQIAVDEINAAGGVNGFKLVLDFQDSQGDPDSAVTAYGNLMDNGMKVSLGTVLSGEMASVVAAAKNDGILLLSPSASAKACIEGNDAAFRVCFNDPQQGTVSADFINDHNLAKKVAVFYQSDNDYSVGLYESFLARAKELGIEVVAETTFTASTNTDFSTQIAAIKNSGAELVFIPIYAAEAATFLTQAYGKLDGVTAFGCDGIDGILTKVSDAKYVEGVMMLTPFAADDPAEDVQAFVKKYKETYKATPDQFAADGYDAVYAIKAALEQAQITSEDKDDFNSRIVAAMTQIEVDGVTGTMTWTKDGETNKDAKAMVIKKGVTQVYTK